jgi:hypothetical protein
MSDCLFHYGPVSWNQNLFYERYIQQGPTTVAARSKARTVFARLNTGIVGSNPTESMYVCVCLFCVCVVLCVGSGLVTGWSPSKEFYRLCIGIKNWKSGQSPKGCRAMRKRMCNSDLTSTLLKNGNLIQDIPRTKIWLSLILLLGSLTVALDTISCLSTIIRRDGTSPKWKKLFYRNTRKICTSGC